jgi:hypothetical protein
MPRNNTGSLRLLFLLLLSCAVCLQAQGTIYLTANGTLPINGDVLTLPTPYVVANYPGPTFFTISAGYSVDLCVSPFSAVTLNLSQYCPKQYLRHYVYNSSGEAPTPFELFLNDYSVSFSGRLALPELAGTKPFTEETQQIELLTNINYYISLQYHETTNKNVTDSIFQLTASSKHASCSPGTIPINNPIGCSSPLGPTVNQATPSVILTVVASDTPPVFPIIIGFDGALVPSFTIDLFGSEGVHDIILLFSYNEYPSKFNTQFTLNTDEKPTDIIEPVEQTYSKNFTGPLPGTYYVTVSTSSTKVRSVQFTLTQHNCSISQTSTTANCQGFEYQTLVGETLSSLTIQNNETLYFAVPESQVLQFGIVAATTTGNFTAYVGQGFFPDVNSQLPVVDRGLVLIQKSNELGQIFIPLNTTNSTTFIVALTGPNNVGFTAWEGSTCPFACNNQGTCSTADFTCSCENGYSGTYCQSSPKKKLSTLYIILIIIGGAIVLAILIGVPVALYLNNRKRARYERV